MLHANFCDSVVNIGRRRMLKIPGMYLLANQLLVNQAVEGSFPVPQGKVIERSPVDKGFIGDRFVPVAFEDDVPVHGGHNAVDDVAGASERRCDQNHQSEVGQFLRHQNVCPILK